MKKVLTIMALMLLLGCGDESSREECHTTVTCEDDLELLCDAPTRDEDEAGNSVEVRACTYITYEHCFEKTVCTKND